jgi:hypothetical protein
MLTATLVLLLPGVSFADNKAAQQQKKTLLAHPHCCTKR